MRLSPLTLALLIVNLAGCAARERAPGTSSNNNGPSSMPTDAGTGGGVVGQACGPSCAAPAFGGEPFCIGTVEDQYCTQLCDVTPQCPAGFVCDWGGPDGNVRYCQRGAEAPSDERLGQACNSNSDCGGTDGVISFAEPFCEPQAAVCSRYCVDDCPQGFVCTAETVLPGVPESDRVCLPMPTGGSAPYDPSPADGERLTGLMDDVVRLRWFQDVPRDTTYTLYFGTANPPPLRESGLTQRNVRIDGVEPSTTYYWKADSSDGTQGPVWSFTTSNQFVIAPCPDAPTVQIGSRSYGTVQIGDTCWTADNVVAGRRATNGTVYDDGELEHFCAGTDSCGYYTWRELAGYTGTAGGTAQICPSGWRVPTRNDWLALREGFSGNISALVMGSMGFQLERDDRYQPRENGASCSLPGSNPPRNVDCTRATLQETRGNPVGWYWTGTRSTASQQGSVELYFDNREFHLDIADTPIEFGLSVRCVR